MTPFDSKRGPNWSQDSYTRAYRFAAKAHRGQTYPGTGLPYIMHISFVSIEVIAALHADPGRKGDLAVQCALLHDVIEDTDVTPDCVRAEFGAQVADGVPVEISPRFALDAAELGERIPAGM